MSLRLTLIRHAKSAWDGEEEDHERPLNKRGRTAAEALGAWLAGHMPDEVLVSDSARTRETWERVAKAGDGPEARAVPQLYLADAATILAVLRGATGRHVGIVGHNPGIGHFADRILAERPVHVRFAAYPTGATTVVGFDEGTWPDVGWGSGLLIDFVVPRDL